MADDPTASCNHSADIAAARPLALVLGAGGPLGWAYHVGVIEGIRSTLGINPATAERVIGTSAGGAIAAGLLAGASADEMLTAIITRPSDEDIAAMRQAAAEFRRPWQRVRPAAPALAVRGLGPLGFGALAGLVPAGVFPSTSLRRFPSSDDWPEALWIPAVRLSDGHTVVFGRDRLDVAVIDAVEATSSVPGMFRPKEIDGERFTDGAVRSATNADLLTSARFNLVVVSSPMTRPGRGMVRTRARWQLQSEIDELRAEGATVVVVEPDQAMVDQTKGYPRTNHEAGPALAEAAAAQTAEALKAATALCPD